MSSIVYFDIPELSIRAKFVNGELCDFEPVCTNDGKWISDAELLKNIERSCAICNALNWRVRNVILRREQDIFNYYHSK